jgi:hypothetical protein
MLAHRQNACASAKSMQKAAERTARATLVKVGLHDQWGARPADVARMRGRRHPAGVAVDPMSPRPDDAPHTDRGRPV